MEMYFVGQDVEKHRGHSHLRQADNTEYFFAGLSRYGILDRGNIGHNKLRHRPVAWRHHLGGAHVACVECSTRADECAMKLGTSLQAVLSCLALIDKANGGACVC